MKNLFIHLCKYLTLVYIISIVYLEYNKRRAYRELKSIA